MRSRNGAEYAQNYDMMVKWLADALRGETLEVIGVKTGRIEDVFGFEVADISVRAGRADVMARDDTGAFYHIEEQRDLSRSDMCRFAAYHFLAADRWGAKLTDIILASGDVYIGEKVIATESGTYSPLVLDFSKKDGRKRLAEIREAVSFGQPVNLLELVFLPLCGKETGTARSEMAEEVIRFESRLWRSGRISARLIAATLIMSNRFIDKDRLRALWEEIKMLDILEIAREEGMKEGKLLGINEGKLLGINEGKLLGILEMLTDDLIERFGLVPARITERLGTVHNSAALKVLRRQISKCQNVGEFEAVMHQVL
ncbi:MAG: hypothetical protein HC887_10110 [Desulfobacteraceae bacterium]|nr:hypothetical protein [Desulfobacteraceae bacterium]